jgi:hypothetical protein
MWVDIVLAAILGLCPNRADSYNPRSSPDPQNLSNVGVSAPTRRPLLHHQELKSLQLPKIAHRKGVRHGYRRLVDGGHSTRDSEELIPSPTPSSSEKAQISIAGDHGYRDLRNENSLTDEHGDEVKLKKGAHVEITVTAKHPLGKLKS